MKSLGDGFLATFDGPARAIRCAAARWPRFSPPVIPSGATNIPSLLPSRGLANGGRGVVDRP